MDHKTPKPANLRVTGSLAGLEPRCGEILLFAVGAVATFGHIDEVTGDVGVGADPAIKLWCAWECRDVILFQFGS